MNRERMARMGLCALKAWSSPALARAWQDFGAAELWEALVAEGESSTFGRRAAVVDPAAVAAAGQACGARFIMPGDEEWPAPLADLEHVEVAGMGGTPAGLWLRGEYLGAVDRAVALVGARACTSYGEHTAVGLAADLAAAGHPVVSGLAFGIDAAAHRGALGAGGITHAVLAGGLDEPYPSAHARLAKSVAASGTLISELPPGERPSRHAFLARNRIIAALSGIVVVVEAAARSGAKNTASWAAALGRPVAAVPGPVTSSLSVTPHRLIRDAEATLVTSADEIRALLAPPGSVPEESSRGESVPIDRLPGPLRELREAVGSGERVTAAQLSARTGQRIIDVLDGAQQLIESGWLQLSGDGEFSLPSRRLG
ncbi:DNA-processing protein DprA [Tessaracoccus lacteus]|uniref:DNA-processing protein DprA n=1 Tax=Tessaracoccus lacteus TaxID=3041766 RepID=A0ABY8PV12_9ACTN|nr:DNA-processing protein DprA [Tessaracoccus sp. T21]WGT46293.1 DNA-processing protein DprA [Tessaracoccus sp. T21]